MKLLRDSLLALTFVAAACGGAEKAATETSAPGTSTADSRPITVKGSDTMVILGQRFAEEYMKVKAGTVVQVTGGGSGTGIAALINGTVDLAQSSRPMKDKEKADAEARYGAPLVERAVAIDALAVFLNASNGVAELSLAQLKDIYQGRITDWQQIGGKSGPIVLYGRENSSGTYEYFKEHVLEKGDYSPRVQTLQGTAAVVNAVSRDPNGIGYGGIAYESNVRLVAVKKDAATPAVAPNEQTAVNGTYPISRQLYFYYSSGAPERVREFADWAVSDAGQAVVKNVGYFPLQKAGSAATGTAAANAVSPAATP